MLILYYIMEKMFCKEEVEVETVEKALNVQHAESLDKGKQYVFCILLLNL